MTVKPTSQRVRKAKVGGVCFDSTRIAFFAGYSECVNCGINGKVLMSVEDAREFGRKIGAQRLREPLGARITQRLVKALRPVEHYITNGASRK